MRSFLLGTALVLILSGCGAPADKGAAVKGMGGFAVPVVGVKVVPRVVLEKISVVGSLTANESIDVKSQVEGKVTEIHFEEGQKVAKGDVLLVLDREKLEASMAEAKANYDMAQTTFNRMKSLVDQGAVSKQEFDQVQSQVAAKQAQLDLISAQLADMVITAPFDGVIGERQVSLGQVINKDRLLTVIIDDNPMKVDFHAPERYISQVHTGEAVELTIAAYPKDVFKGEVYFVDPQVDQLTRTFLVKARIPNEDNKLRRGMFAKLDLIINEKEGALLIPETALIPKGDEVFVFTVDKDNKAQMVQVKTGIREIGSVEITSGLKAQDTVITEGYQKIGPGSPVSVTAPDANASNNNESAS